MRDVVLIFKHNYASFEELLCFFEKNADLFVPDLNLQVESLYVYVDKLKKNATIIEAYDDGTLVGLVAIYLNNYETKIAFISSILVSAEYQGKRIARTLLKMAIKAAVLKKFAILKLEVFNNNDKAINLYKKLGFKENTQKLITVKPFSPIEAKRQLIQNGEVLIDKETLVEMSLELKQFYTNNEHYSIQNNSISLNYIVK